MAHRFSLGFPVPQKSLKIDERFTNHLVDLINAAAISLVRPVLQPASEIGLDNYIVSGKPHTWSAFTFEQMLPQKVSWKIHYKNAQSIMTMSAYSKASRVELVHGLAH